MSPSNEKGSRYIDLLDAARCNANWSDVPELVRKIRKHVPDRKCLILTACSELEIVKHIATKSSSRNPAQGEASLAQLIPPLLSAVEARSTPADDAFQGRTCLAMLHWILSEHAKAVSCLPDDISTTFEETSSGTKGYSNYSALCMLRCYYINAKYREGDQAVANLETPALVEWIHANESRIVPQPSLLLWSEQLLAQLAVANWEDADLIAPQLRGIRTRALMAFRQWANLAVKHQGRQQDEFGVVNPVLSKIEIWKSYYHYLSKLVQLGVDTGPQGDRNGRIVQSGELRRVESYYEQELLRTIKFPKSNESNQPVEDWVEQAIRNWRVLCGRSWTESDLGEGGHDAVGRNVLDILYRAATKTFHSTLILRRLFQVHKSLAEFELAYKAFDSYLGLVSRAKARDLKTDEDSQADDEYSILLTLSEAVEGLCIYGRQNEAEEVFEITQVLEKWTEDCSRRVRPSVSGENSAAEETVNHEFSQAMETADRAIGLGKAFWARWTPFSESRSSIQAEALASLARASTGHEGVSTFETLFAHSLLLAQSRDIDAAIMSIKAALTLTTGKSSGQQLAKQKQLPALHLLALLLSANQDFQSAYRVCAAASEQINDDELSHSQNASYSTLQTNGEKGGSHANFPLSFEEMEVRDLQRIFELEMTKLTIVEIVEGAEDALGESDQLLSLFSRVFAHLGLAKDDKPRKQSLIPPKSSAGTAKSLRGSIFGRRHRGKPESVLRPKSNGVDIGEATLERQSTRATEAPTIQITDEDSVQEKEKHHKFRRSFSHHSHIDSPGKKLHKREGSKAESFHRHSKNLSPKSIDGTISEQQRSRNSTEESTAAETATPTSPKSPSSSRDKSNTLNTSLTTEIRSSAQQISPLSIRRRPQPSAADSHSAAQTLPPIRLPRIASQIQAYTILIKIWLFVSGLYRRATLYEESKEALDEATRNTSLIESLAATQESSAHAFSDPGWGGSKSVNELWADVNAERGHLALARRTPHEAIKRFEEALAFSSDHPRATIALSGLLLDIYEQKIPNEAPKPGIDLSSLQPPLDPSHTQISTDPSPSQSQSSPTHNSTTTPRPATAETAEELRKTPANLDRLAARDRAYGLLANLTKLGSSWDDAEAWYALARAHECSGQVEKAREVLWFVVELEETRPVRGWGVVGGVV